jgi:hypothetical protein
MQRAEKSRSRKALYRPAIHQDNGVPMWKKAAQELSISLTELKSIWDDEQAGTTSLLNPKRVKELRQFEANKAAKQKKGTEDRETRRDENREKHWKQRPSEIGELYDATEQMLFNTVNKQVDNAVTAADILWRKRSTLDRYLLENYPRILDAMMEIIHLSGIKFEEGVIRKRTSVEALREHIGEMPKEHRHETPEEAIERFEKGWRKAEVEDVPYTDMELARKHVLACHYHKMNPSEMPEPGELWDEMAEFLSSERDMMEMG